MIRRSVFLCALSSCFCEFFGENLCLGLDKTALPADVRTALLAAAAKSAAKCKGVLIGVEAGSEEKKVQTFSSLRKDRSDKGVGTSSTPPPSGG